VLSLDAPLVSVLWQALLARVVLLRLDWAATVVLGLSVWLAYAADRAIEGWRLDRTAVQTPRHRFYQRFARPVAIAWCVVLAVDVWIAVSRLSRFDLLAGFVLMVSVAAYLLSHQLVHRHHPWRVPKEICVAALLSGGVAVFLLRAPSLGQLTIPLTLFGLLCFVNTALISAWEQQVDRAQGQTSLVIDYRGAASVIPSLPWLTAALAAPAALSHDDVASIAAVCAGASALLLAAIDRAEPRIGWQAARVLSDLALMSPLVPLLWL
jgi:hypothetical protein